MTGEEQAIDALLGQEPGNIAALVRKGELRRLAGDDRAAFAFFKSALQTASQLGALPASLRPAIEAAQDGVARASRLFEEHLEARLAAAGLPAAERPPRFQESVEILTGRRPATMQLQRPGSYYFPGLPQRRFYERSEFAWAPAIEAATGAIRDELAAWLAAGEDQFSPYLVSDPTRPRKDFHGLVDNPSWSTLDLYADGRPVAEHAARFPRTFAALAGLPLPSISTRAPAVLFSRLAPGARIPAHHGAMNARLICHLPLIVPEGSVFRVGGEARPWQEGELLIFDDTVLHEAWNDGAADRIILIFDVWRPELSDEERRAVGALFEAVDSYGR